MNAQEWVWYTPEEPESFIFGAKDVRFLEFEVRSTQDVQVNLVTLDGQTLHIDQDRIVRFKGRVDGFGGIEVVAETAFAVKSNVSRSRWKEIVDPTPARLIVKEPADPVKAEIARQLREYIAKREMAEQIGSLSVEDLMDDLENGDLEFEDEFEDDSTPYEELEPFDDEDEPEPEPEPSPSNEGPAKAAVSGDAGGEADDTDEKP